MKKQEPQNSRRLLPLHNDIVFKIFCIKKPNLLGKLLDAILGFKGSGQIRDLQILNPELPGDIYSDKLSVLDIHAINRNGEHFGVEMQAFPQNYYGKRALYYWAKLYTSQIDRGNNYFQLQPVYSVSFLNYKLLKVIGFHSTFYLQEKDRPEIILTKDLEIHIIELPGFLKKIRELDTELEDWIYLLREAEHLQDEDMKELQERNPIIEEAIEALKDISLDKKTRDYYEMRIKSERDFYAMKEYAFEEGIKKGIEDGIEKGIERGIERGIEKGIKQGIEQGIQLERKRTEKLLKKTTLRTAIKLKKSGNSLDTVAEIVELPPDFLLRFFKKIHV